MIFYLHKLQMHGPGGSKFDPQLFFPAFAVGVPCFPGGFNPTTPH